MQDKEKNNDSIQTDKTRFIISFSIALFFLLIMIIIWILDDSLNLDLFKYGVYPAKIFGLKGIIFSPFIHGSIKHLFSNSLPFLVLLTGLLFFFPKKGLLILLLITIGSNIFVWMVGRPSYHIGASGIIYGLASFIFFSGVLSRRKEYIALSLIVIFLYGSLIWGIFPGADKSISWEAHLGGFAVGTLLSLIYHPKKLKFYSKKELTVDYIFPYNYKSFNSTNNKKINYFYTKFYINNNYIINYEKNFTHSDTNFEYYFFTSTKTVF